MAVLSQPPYPPTLPGEPQPSSKPKRLWRQKFGNALYGLKLGVRGNSSFFVHFFAAALVVTAASILRCNLEQWCLLLGCIGMVLAAELFNSAIETLFRGLDDETKERAWQCLDIAAGAVLLVSLFAAIIGAVIFLRQLELL